MDRLRQLEIFAAVVREGGFSAAARELRLSTAGVSGAIRSLETWLGARVLHRTTRAMALTEAGRDMLARGERILAELEAARIAATADGAGVRGVIRLSAPVSYGMLRLGAVFAEYAAAAPEVRLVVELSDRRVDLIAEGYDLAIRIGHALDPGLVARRLARHRLVLCGSPDYLRRRGSPAAPDDLRAHDCLVFTPRLPVGRWQFRDGGGRRRIVAVAGPIESDNGQLLRDAAIAGLGLTLAPDFLVDEALASGALVEVLPDWRSHEIAVHSVRPAGGPATASVAGLIAHLAARLKD